MAIHRIKRGLDLPITGAPEQRIDDAAKPVTRVAVVADDFPGMKPRMAVAEGDTVRRGQLLFEDRKCEGVRHVSPGAGKVLAIHRGAKRALQSVVIELSEGEVAGTPSADELVSFASYTGKPVVELERHQIVELLVESGMWTSLRTRPFSHTPAIDAVPAAIFVNGMDTNPLCGDPAVMLADRGEDLEVGLGALAKLTEGKTYFCVAPGSALARELEAPVQVEEFSGPHPAGTAGVHVHTLDAVSLARSVWTVGVQEVVAMGALLRTGELSVERVIALSGPSVKKPRLLRTRMGARVADLVAGELTGEPVTGDTRVISGSVLSGKATMDEHFGYLGRHHWQVSALGDAPQREFLGMIRPGLSKFSVIGVFLSKLIPGKKFAFDTDSNGSPRAMVPIGLYEKVMPMDILPTFLLRSMVVGDDAESQKLGILELDEEDLALCTFVDPGKTDYGPILRENLERIFKEG